MYASRVNAGLVNGTMPADSMLACLARKARGRRRLSGLLASCRSLFLAALSSTGIWMICVPRAMAVDVSTQAQLNTAVANGSSISITSGDLALSSGQTLSPTADLAIAAGASLDTTAAGGQQVGSLAGDGTLTIGTTTFVFGTDNANTGLFRHRGFEQSGLRQSFGDPRQDRNGNTDDRWRELQSGLDVHCARRNGRRRAARHP